MKIKKATPGAFSRHKTAVFISALLLLHLAAVLLVLFSRRPDLLPPPSLPHPCIDGISVCDARGRPLAELQGPLVLKEEDGREFSVFFPRKMVSEERINMGGVNSPLAVSPDLPGFRFLWKSQREGLITLPWELQPGTTYQISLSPGVIDIEGRELRSRRWGLALRSRPFEVTVSHRGREETEWLESVCPLPLLRLTFTYPVSLQEVTRSCYFQDRESNRRCPVEVVLEGDQEDEPQKSVLIRPVNPLATGCWYDLIVDGIRDAVWGTEMPRLKVSPVGKTFPLDVEYAVGRHWPLEGAFVQVRFSDTADWRSLENAFRFEPDIPIRKVSRFTELNGDDVRIDADFDTEKVYRLHIADHVCGVHSAFLETPESRRIRFPDKRPAVIFPEKCYAMRSQASIEFPFRHVQTGPLLWRIAPVPLALYCPVMHDLRAFEWYRAPSSEDEELEEGQGDYGPPKPPQFLLIPAHGLKTVATGTVAGAVGNKEILRTIDWRPTAGPPPAGMYLVEVSGKGAKGRSVGNHSLLFLTDYVVTRKSTASRIIVRVADMRTRAPVPDVHVALLDEVKRGENELSVLSRARTNRDGEALFDKPDSKPDLIQVDSALHEFNMPRFAAADPPSLAKPKRDIVFTDRNIYRPGDTVHFKGVSRLWDGQYLAVPRDTNAVAWTIDLLDEEGAKLSSVAKGAAPLSDFGTWDGSYELPEDASLATYTVNGKARFQVRQFRQPLFNVDARAEDTVGSNATVEVRSEYFHGRPNAGARVHWRASWKTTADATRMIRPFRHHTMEDSAAYLLRMHTLYGSAFPASCFRTSDDAYPLDFNAAGVDLARLYKRWYLDEGTYYEPFSETATAPEAAQAFAEDFCWDHDMVTEGVVFLDKDGAAVISTPCPFDQISVNFSRALVDWHFEVTSSTEAQTVYADARQLLQIKPLLVAMRTGTGTEDGSIRLRVDSVSIEDATNGHVPVDLELLAVGVKTIHEKLSDRVHRYRNFRSARTIRKWSDTTPVNSTLSVPGAGIYVVRARRKDDPEAAIMSRDILATGIEYAEVDVCDDKRIAVRADRPVSRVGESTGILIEAPFRGKAWITVEAEEVIEGFQFSLPGNVARFDLHVKETYFPNAVVSVYLLDELAGEGLPLERFGFTRLEVADPRRSLDVSIRMEKQILVPGGQTSGSVQVSALGEPVAASEVTLFAVDERVLYLGSWQFPDFVRAFSPRRRWGVETFSALHGFTESIDPASLFQKGFLVGDGGAYWDARRDFTPLALWLPNLHTDSEGCAGFNIVAPDSLTRYRVTAFATEGADRFGFQQSQFTVQKALEAEPILPAKLRHGEEVELRVVLRQREAPLLPVRLQIRTIGATLLDAASRDLQLPASAPLPVGVRVKVPRDGSNVKVAFDVQDLQRGDLRDAVVRSIPVFDRDIERVGVRSGIVPREGLDPVRLVAEAWPGTVGKASLYVSSSPVFPTLMSVPLALDLPVVTLEQTTRNMLCILLAQRYGDYFPARVFRRARLGNGLQDALHCLWRSQLEEPGFPIFRGEQEANPQVTIQAAWALARAASLGTHDVSPTLLSGSASYVAGVLGRLEGYENHTAFTRCFALFAHAILASVPDAALAARGVDPLAQAEALYLDRVKYDAATRSMLAIALSLYPSMRTRAEQVLAESGDTGAPRAFDSREFNSRRRTEALRLYARCRVNSGTWNASQFEEAQRRLVSLARGGGGLNDPADLWLQLCLEHLIVMRGAAPLPAQAATPLIADFAHVVQYGDTLWSIAHAYGVGVETVRRVNHVSNSVIRLGQTLSIPSPVQNTSAATREPFLVAPNRTAFGWEDLDGENMRRVFSEPLRFEQPVTYVLTYRYREPLATEAEDGGLRLERIVTNLTDGNRTGSPEAPLQLGDELLVQYRIHSKHQHALPLIQDRLPSAIEVLNPNLPLFRKHYNTVLQSNDFVLDLSQSEIGKEETRLHFRVIEPGTSTYAVLARVIVAGSFDWSGAQVRPLHDPRFVGRSALRKLAVTGE